MSDMSRPSPPPPAADHERHDALLVAQLAAGDPLEPDRRTEAERLVRSCAACAALAADLRLVSTAVAREPVPPRRRDFSLSPEQAERLSGNAFTRALRRLTLPSSRAFQPVAAGVLSIGLLFVVAGYAWPGDGAGTVTAEPNFATYDDGTLASAAPAADVPSAGEPAPLVTERDGAEPDVVGEVELASPDAAFLESLSEHQAGTSERMNQKSVESAAEEAEGDLAQRSASARSAPAATVLGEALEQAAAADEDGGLAASAAQESALDAAVAAEEPELAAASVADAELAAAAEELDAAAPAADAVEETAADAVDEETEGAVNDVTAAATAVDDVTTPTSAVGGEAAVPANEGDSQGLLVVVGLLLALAGGGALLLGWLVRRSRDPLLR